MVHQAAPAVVVHGADHLERAGVVHPAVAGTVQAVRHGVAAAQAAAAQAAVTFHLTGPAVDQVAVRLPAG